MKRTIKLGLSLLLFLLLFACTPEAEKEQNLGSLFPESIGEWQQTQLITGTKALEKIDRLHGKTPALTQEQAEVMADKMVSNPRSPFHDPETLSINKIKVYKFLGMGQIHYIFCRERLAYWISSPPADGKKLLQYFL